jgi:hypothetical protein
LVWLDLKPLGWAEGNVLDPEERVRAP